MTAVLAATQGQQPRGSPLKLAALVALLVGAVVFTWSGSQAEQPLELTLQNGPVEEPAGVCAAALAARAAAAAAAAVEAGEPPLAEVEAAAEAQQCSDEHRAASYKNATEGEGPPLMEFDCPMEQARAAGEGRVGREGEVGACTLRAGHALHMHACMLVRQLPAFHACALCCMQRVRPSHTALAPAAANRCQPPPTHLLPVARRPHALLPLSLSLPPPPAAVWRRVCGRAS